MTSRCRQKLSVSHVSKKLKRCTPVLLTNSPDSTKQRIDGWSQSHSETILSKEIRFLISEPAHQLHLSFRSVKTCLYFATQLWLQSTSVLQLAWHLLPSRTIHVLSYFVWHLQVEFILERSSSTIMKTGSTDWWVPSSTNLIAFLTNYYSTIHAYASFVLLFQVHGKCWRTDAAWYGSLPNSFSVL